MTLLDKSISQIENWNWNQPIPTKEDSSYEEYNFYRLHKKPISQFKIEDIYFMIDQGACLSILTTLALDILAKDVLIQAEDYEGDLLIRVLRLTPEFWKTNENIKLKLAQILKKNQNNISDFKFERGIKQELYNLLETFYKY